MKKLFLTLALLAFASPAFAQITVPNTFISGTTILASAVNANFDKLEADALNRTGGTMTGNLIFSPDATYDIGAAGATRPRDIRASRKIYTYDLTLTNDLQGVTATFSGAVTAGGLTFSSGAITGLTSLSVSGTATATTFSGSGASLTSIPESGITDGAILARVGGNETITGQWTFNAATTPITVSPGAGTSTFQAVSATTGTFSGAVSSGGLGFSGPGASITGIQESAITDASILARIAANETISGTWTFSNAITSPSGVLWSGKDMDVFNFGGDWREYFDDTTYPAGETMAATIPGTGVWYVDGTQFPGTYRLEGICKSNTGTPTATVSIRKLLGDVLLTGGETTVATSTAGERFVTGSFTFPSGTNWFFIKGKTTAGYVSCWAIRVVRLS